MNVVHIRPNARIFTLLGVAVLALAGLTLKGVQAQTKTPDTSASVTADQQKQLDHLRQLGDQLQKDRDAVDAAAGAHGWDSNEADATQQQLFKDRQEYRSLRRSLQAAGVSLPSDTMRSGTGNQSTQNGNCCGHRHGHHDCCGGAHDCASHNGDCAHHGNHCCH
jgi:Tfp pilus assembly protein PilV